MSEFMIVNPKRRRRKGHAKRHRRSRARAFHHNPAPSRRRRRRSRRFHNPSARTFMGIDLMKVGIGIGGASVAAIALKLGNKYLPANLQTGPANAAVKVAAYLVTAKAAEMAFGKAAGATVLGAGALIEGFKLVNDHVLPSLNLGDVGTYVTTDQLAGYVAVSPDQALAGLGADPFAPPY